MAPADSNDPDLHPLLIRQLERCGVEAGSVPDPKAMARFIKRVDIAYRKADETDRARTEGMQRAATEMQDLYEHMRRSNERELSAHRHQLHVVLDALGHGVVAGNSEGEVLMMNAAAKRMIGGEPADGQELVDRFSTRGMDPTGPSSMEYIGRTLQGERFLEVAAQITPYHGQVFEVSSSLTPLRDELGAPNGIALIFHDVTERNHTLASLAVALDEANAAVEAKSRFLATMSHELRTPLNGVLGMLELLGASDISEAQVDMIDVARMSAHQLLGLLTDLLELAKLDDQEAEAKTIETFAVVDLLEAVASSVERRAAGNRNRVDLSILPDPSVTCRADRATLYRAVLALADNAVRFCADGRVLLAAELVAEDPTAASGAGLSLQVTVSDEGPGIPDEQIERIFEPFTQGDNSTTRTHEGAGLGLATCRALVRRLDGTIQFAQARSQGTEVTVTIPVGGELPGPEHAASAPASGSSPSGTADPDPGPDSTERSDVLAVLVAEDNPTNKVVIKALLAKLGHDATIVSDGQQAVEAAQSGSFDVILMDCMMPVLDGYQATEQIRQLPEPVGSIPIVALTANAMPEDREACLAAGMDRVLTKPVALEQLGQTLISATGGQSDHPVIAGGNVQGQ